MYTQKIGSGLHVQTQPAYTFISDVILDAEVQSLGDIDIGLQSKGKHYQMPYVSVNQHARYMLLSVVQSMCLLHVDEFLADLSKEGKLAQVMCTL